MFQKTVKEKVICEGYGLHTGEFSRVTIHPAEASYGIVFIKKNGSSIRYIPLKPQSIKNTLFATTIGDEVVTISTVEHLLATLNGFGIDNAIIEVEGDELPGGDGSANIFSQAIFDAGVITFSDLSNAITFDRKFTVEYNDGYITYLPDDLLTINGTIDFSHPKILKQVFVYKNSMERFISDLSNARTFGFLKDYSTMQALGLAKGSSLENTIVLDETDVMNIGGLRYNDEFIRHKILDLLGDLYIIGNTINGRINSYKSGHALNHLFVQQIISMMESNTIIEQELIKPAVVFSY
ncbi:MAG: UDP-3-O-acyl-N-acetylglucosamine deacetylase [Deltaproteobacteria bacterium]|nr:UDP-3-O-acyl-N-acetylglucosamine deacetylase [Deltaproteobacteria bacterium]MCL5791616.1 UDP-3-O-acyl-N-acetylglucosamine deacetylase [Deltaproteobacteria bacterium]